MSERPPIEGGDFRELDFREDSWHSVWLAWSREYNIVAVVMAQMVTDVEYYDDMEVETSYEEIKAAIVPHPEASEAFIHPEIYIRWFGKVTLEGSIEDENTI